MLTADELITSIEEVFNSLDPDLEEKLRRSQGYAFEAYTLTWVGDALCRLKPTWQWQHPNGRSRAYFSGRAGAPLAVSAARTSHVRNFGGGRASRALCQSVEVDGPTGVTHSFDAVLVRSIDAPSDEPLPFYESGAVVECKNWTSKPGLGLAREMVGVAIETRSRCWACRSQARVHLISTTEPTDGATSLMQDYDIRVHVDRSTPLSRPSWADAVARDLRWQRRCYCITPWI